MSGAKNFCFTLFDFELHDKFVDYDYEYLIMGLETCPETQKKHYQGFIRFKSTKKLTTMISHFPKVHFEFMETDVVSCINYCKKEGDWKEYGISPLLKQGQRSDLVRLKNEILAGEQTSEDILVNMPGLFHQYGRTFEKIEDIRMRKLFRTFMTQGFWLWGDTGAGKSHAAFKDFDPEKCFVLNLNDKGWWDGYRQQETVIINEFRGQIAYGELLDLVDKYPKSVPRRGREPLPFISKRVIITSALRPDDVYHNLSLNDSLKQLERRFKIIRVRSGQEVILDS